MGQLEDNVSTLLERSKNTDKTLDTISGDVKAMRKNLNDEMTKVALVKQSMARLWWWVGGISICILGVAVKSAMAGGDPVEKLTCFIMSIVQSL